MDTGVLLVVGGSGDVGRGIVRSAIGLGRKVVVSGRGRERLEELASEVGSPNLKHVPGSLATEASAAALWRDAAAAFGGITDVVVSVNAPNESRPVLEWQLDDLNQVLAANVLTHFTAAKTFLPHLPDNGTFIGIGGGTADFLFPGLAAVSMGQAALRMLYRGLAKERRAGPQIRELMIVSMVAGDSNRASAPDDWITAEDVGRHVCAILDNPGRFAKPIQRLCGRDQVGEPEA